jgi:hypothetical protein
MAESAKFDFFKVILFIVFRAFILVSFLSGYRQPG